MEYIEGETLDANLRKGPLEISRLIDLAIQIADALEEAHSKKIIHRDLKPSNIAITPRGEIKVLDFGLAKIVRKTDATTDLSTITSTQAGRVVGTVPYMSPEQLLGKGLDSRTDIFSSGIILYQMCTGRLPFSGATALETFHLIAHETRKQSSGTTRRLRQNWGVSLASVSKKIQRVGISSQKNYSPISTISNAISNPRKSQDKTIPP